MSFFFAQHAVKHYLFFVSVFFFLFILNGQVRAHRQAWAWQDEWHGLTMEDIRNFERETQQILQNKFGSKDTDGEDNDDGELSLEIRLMHFQKKREILIL